MSHLILYDASCPLCRKAVEKLIMKDKKKKLLFSSLVGKTARSFCNTIHLDEGASIVLIENYQSQKQAVYIKAKAIFRIFWLLGGKYKLVGWKYILPSKLMDPFYDFIAKRRSKISRSFKIQDNELSKPGRFLP